MRLRSMIGFGTSSYPEKVARRLRAMNIAAWVIAALVGLFAIRHFAYSGGGGFVPALQNAAAAVGFAALPMLHRFGPFVGPLAFAILAYGFLYVVVSRDGIGGGGWVGYLMAAPIIVLLLGGERIILSLAFGAAALVLIVSLHLTVPYDTGYVSPQSLFYGYFVINVAFCIALLILVVHYAERQIAGAEAAVEREYERSEDLLLNILPAPIAKRLKSQTQSVIADSYDDASILFADIADFTERVSDMSAEELVGFLNDAYSRFDRLVERYGLEKIKTTGDAYMVASGVPMSRPDHAQVLADFALALRDAAAGLRDPRGRAVSVRIGIGSGPVVAGVVGTRRIFYDVWGDAVNVASRMETTGQPGRIQVSSATFEKLKDQFDLEPRGPIEVKGKGRVETWYLVRRRQRWDVVPLI